jgi:hypothetical protein
MDCREFKTRIEEALMAPRSDALRRHSDACPGCRRMLGRAEFIGRSLAATPAEVPGPGLDRGSLPDLRITGEAGIGVFLRIAATVLILASGGIAALLGLSPARARESLALKVVVETATEGDLQDLALEEMYGPDASGNPAGKGGYGATFR